MVWGTPLALTSDKSRVSLTATYPGRPMPRAGLAFTTVAEFGRLGLQVWVGREDFNPAIVGKNPWPSSPRPKPSHGFFTSSWDEVSKTSAWMRSRSYILRSDSERDAPVFLNPVLSATLLVIDSVDDFDRLASQYPQTYPNPRNPTVRPDWARLAGLIDAVHVTARAVTDEDNPYAHAWEVESTLWFRGATLVSSS
jgi:hypothetical protein